jgi:glycerol-3-phosphate dehydrogenase
MHHNESYDIIVIGGGIHGTGVAQAAAASGYSVLLLEQHSLASGTSSRSSKLIHGGLRYLESGQLSLVRECLRERAILLKIAPDLVKLVPFFIPIYRQTIRRPWQIRAGLSMYSLLAGLKKNTLFNSVPKHNWSALDGLDTTNLHQVFRYYDAQTDDRLLTQTVMQSALELGATLKIQAEFQGAEIIQDRCRVTYSQDKQTLTGQAKCVVNAAGPWVNSVLQRISPRPSMQRIDLVQGTHIVLKGEINQGIYYVEAPQDKRAVFVMPWHEKIMIGTTETHFQGDPENVKPLDEEKTYLFATLAKYFPAFREKSTRDIEQAFAGLRVLPADSSPAFHRPRDTVLQLDNPTRPRVLTIYGGKLTTYRSTAQKVLQMLSRTLPRRRRIADTAELRLRPVKGAGGP